MNDDVRQVECTIPILPVQDLARSIRFYTETLGFQLDWGGANKVICSVSRDSRPIMLVAMKEPRPPVWVWIGLADATLFDVYKSRGVMVVQEPQNHPWAYEMKFADPDGNILWLGTETRRDLPVEGAG